MLELRNEREILEKLIPSLKFDGVQLQPWIYERHAIASDESTRAVYLDALSQSNLYIGILWNQYGEWTIDEYERAKDWGIDSLVFVKNVNSTQRDNRLAVFLNELGNVTAGIATEWFVSDDDFVLRVTRALEKWVAVYRSGPPGDNSARIYNSRDMILERAEILIGRDDALQNAENLLSHKQKVLLQGFSGEGKTALAAELAARHLEMAKANIVLWIRAGRSDTDRLFEAIARPFGVDAVKFVFSQKSTDQIHALREVLQQNNITLVVLDDSWNGAALSSVIRAIPSSASVVVTSRNVYPSFQHVKIEKLSRLAALNLLSFHAGFDYTENQAASQLCEILEDFAFSIRIAGLILSTDNLLPSELYSYISKAPHSIQMPLDFEADRNSLGVLLDYSLRTLNLQEQEVFYAFGALFAPQSTVELLATFVKQPVNRVETTLTTLHRRGLATRILETEEKVAYYSIHGLAYSYSQAGITNRIKRKSLKAFGKYLDKYGTSSIDSRRNIYPVLGNILRCANWAIEHGHANDTLAYAMIIGQQTQLVQYYGLHVDTLHLVRLGIKAAQLERRRDMEGAVTHLLGLFLKDLGRLQEAIECFKAAIELGENYEQGLGASLGELAKVYVVLGDYDKATAPLNRALKIAQDVQDRSLESDMFCTIGDAYLGAQNYTEAEKFYKLGLSVAQKYGMTGLSCLQRLGSVYIYQEKYLEAKKIIDTCKEIARKLGSKTINMSIISNYATLYASLGQYEEAADMFEQALAYSRQIDDKRAIADDLQSLAVIYQKLERFPEAISYLQEAFEFFEATNITYRTIPIQNSIVKIQKQMQDKNNQTN